MAQQEETNSILHQQERCASKTLDIRKQVTKLPFEWVDLVSFCSILELSTNPLKKFSKSSKKYNS